MVYLCTVAKSKLEWYKTKDEREGEEKKSMEQQLSYVIHPREALWFCVTDIVIALVKKKKNFFFSCNVWIGSKLFLFELQGVRTVNAGLVFWDMGPLAAELSRAVWCQSFNALLQD